MTEISRHFRGWTIVGLILGLILLIHGINELSMIIAIWATARISCLLFIAAFVASCLRNFSFGKFCLSTSFCYVVTSCFFV